MEEQKETLYSVTNERFSRDEWIGTFSEIVAGIISCNWSWETDYKESDFEEKWGFILCRGEKIAERYDSKKELQARFADSEARFFAGIESGEKKALEAVERIATITKGRRTK